MVLTDAVFTRNQLKLEYEDLCENLIFLRKKVERYGEDSDWSVMYDLTEFKIEYAAYKLEELEKQIGFLSN